jgi:prolipoprotein diacylglyceryltransferase
MFLFACMNCAKDKFETQQLRASSWYILCTVSVYVMGVLVAVSRLARIRLALIDPQHNEPEHYYIFLMLVSNMVVVGGMRLLYIMSMLPHELPPWLDF